jgi:hypothetical protein
VKRFNIIEAIEHPKIFRPLLGDLKTWFAWTVFLKAVFGLDMDNRERELYQRCTHRDRPPKGGVKESYAIVGRRGGKSRIVAFAGVFIGCFRDFKKHLAAGETGMCLVLARDRDQAKVVFNYITGILKAVPAFKQMVSAWRADEVELASGITIAVKTSDYRTVRGVTLVCCIADEVAFWDNQGVNPDAAIFQALRPAMATIPEAKLLVISSPYAKYGVLYEAHRRYYGQDDPRSLVWQADTRTMNPNITQEFIAQEMDRDPDAGRSEWLAQFREDIEAAFSLESIEACVIDGRTELLPAQSIPYVAFVDPSGGRRDQFTVAVAHRGKENAIIDTVKAWKPPFDPSEVVKECTEVLKPYRIRALTGDNYGGEWPVAEFRKHGIAYQLSERNRSQLYLELIPVLNSRRVELPDNRKLIDELRRLERRRGRSGKDSIDHPGYGSDDLANSTAGAVSLVMAKPIANTKALPMGVGNKTFASEAAKIFGSSLGSSPSAAWLGGSYDDEEPPAKESYRYRFWDE